MSQERIRILEDEDGHNYFVPENKVAGFSRWVMAMEDADEDYEGDDYSVYEIGCSLTCFTFADPQEDR